MELSYPFISFLRGALESCPEVPDTPWRKTPHTIAAAKVKILAHLRWVIKNLNGGRQSHAAEKRKYSPSKGGEPKKRFSHSEIKTVWVPMA